MSQEFGQFMVPKTFQIAETMLKNVPSRDKMIDWLCKMAQMNIKQAGMQDVSHEMTPTKNQRTAAS